MAKKLSEILGEIEGIDLEFVDLQKDETRNGDPLLRLVLKNPIPSVQGRMIEDAATGDRVRLVAEDVEVVILNPDSIAHVDRLEEKELEKPENERVMPIVWIEEGKSGRIKCDLKLDVSSALEVYAVKESFSKWGQKQRDERRSKRTSSLVEKLREKSTRKAFEAKEKPEPTTGE